MKRENIQVWQFDKAPSDLRSLHTGPGDPEWLVLIPASQEGCGIEDWIRGRKALDARQYKTSLGDTVYIGSNDAVSVLVDSTGAGVDRGPAKGRAAQAGKDEPS